MTTDKLTPFSVVRATTETGANSSGNSQRLALSESEEGLPEDAASQMAEQKFIP